MNLNKIQEELRRKIITLKISFKEISHCPVILKKIQLKTRIKDLQNIICKILNLNVFSTKLWLFSDSSSSNDPLNPISTLLQNRIIKSTTLTCKIIIFNKNGRAQRSVLGIINPKSKTKKTQNLMLNTMETQGLSLHGRCLNQRCKNY